MKIQSRIEALLEKIAENSRTAKMVVVTELPQTGENNYIYLIKDTTATGNDKYKEYIWDENNSQFIMIGDTSLDMSMVVEQSLPDESDLKSYMRINWAVDSMHIQSEGTPGYGANDISFSTLNKPIKLEAFYSDPAGSFDFGIDIVSRNSLGIILQSISFDGLLSSVVTLLRGSMIFETGNFNVRADRLVWSGQGNNPSKPAGVLVKDANDVIDIDTTITTDISNIKAQVGNIETVLNSIV